MGSVYVLRVKLFCWGSVDERQTALYMDCRSNLKSAVGLQRSIPSYVSATKGWNYHQAARHASLLLLSFAVAAWSNSVVAEVELVHCAEKRAWG